MQNNNENKENLYIHPIYNDYASNLKGEIFSLKFEKIKKLKLSISNSSYLIFTIEKNSKYVHHFVWECITQTLPIWGQQSDSNTINHINSNKLDNRFDNLEIKTHKENLQLREDFQQENKKSGLPKGVYLNKNNMNYYVQIYHDSKLNYYGTFETIKESEEVAIKQRKLLFPND